jgi:hypothetical protein
MAADIATIGEKRAGVWEVRVFTGSDALGAPRRCRERSVAASATRSVSPPSSSRREARPSPQASDDAPRLRPRLRCGLKAAAAGLGEILKGNAP